MRGTGARCWLAGVLVAAPLVLGGCAGHGHHAATGDDEGLNAVPKSYRADIAAAMHAYLNDPTGIREAGVSELMQKSVNGRTRYVACVRFNGKRKANEYAGVKEVAAVFIVGRFDQFVEQAPAREICAGVAYAPFPELENLSR